MTTGILQFAHPCSFLRVNSQNGDDPHRSNRRARLTHSDTHYDGWRTAGINIAGTFALDVLAGTPSQQRDCTKWNAISPRTRLSHERGGGDGVRVFDDDDGGTHGTDSALGNMGTGSAIDTGESHTQGKEIGGATTANTTDISGYALRGPT
jgi:hypothetical protein